MEAAVATTCVSFLLINVSTAVSQAIWLMRTKKLQWRERQTTKQPFKPSFNVIIQNRISMTVLPALSPPSLPIFFSSMHLTFSLYLSMLILRFTTCINAGKPKVKLEDEPISMPQVPSTRWSPTPEQLMILEEMYRSGVRTPNASQIQQITAHLSFYGKIEGKNVFYWFQNHKARERQKLRRRLGRQQQQQQQQQPCPQHLPHLNNLDNASLTSSPLYPHSLPPFYHQGGIPDETEGLDLLGKLETGGRRGEASSSGTSSRCRCEWMAMLEPCSEDPPMTLELFPTQSTGLRDECSTSKSSSCSASTN